MLHVYLFKLSIGLESLSISHLDYILFCWKVLCGLKILSDPNQHVIWISQFKGRNINTKLIIFQYCFLSNVIGKIVNAVMESIFQCHYIYAYWHCKCCRHRKIMILSPSCILSSGLHSVNWGAVSVRTEQTAWPQSLDTPLAQNTGAQVKVQSLDLSVSFLLQLNMFEWCHTHPPSIYS